VSRSHTRAASRLLLFAAGFLFSTGGAAIKAVTLAGWQVACVRSAIAAVALLALVPGARRGWSWRVWVAGLAYALTLLLFVLSNRLTTAANAVFLQSAGPLYLLLIGPVLLKEPIRRGDVPLILALSLGMSLFFVGREAPLATAPNPALGNILAAASGLTWAFTVTGLRWLGRSGASHDGALATVAAGNILACFVALPMALPAPSIGARDVLVLVYLGVFQVGLAYVCMSRAIRHVPAFEASTLLLVEPALNPIWAWLVHGERPGVLSLAGGAIILASTLASSWWHTRAERAPSQAP
jgi:drug/metabolite transporter (DMT)-like permease